MISGILKFGIFVQLRAYDIDGLIKIESIRIDRFSYDEQTQKLIGRRSGVVFSLGDLVKVKLLRSSAESREIDFEWIDDAASDSRKTNREDFQERSPRKANSERVREARFPQRGRKGKARKVHSKKNRKGRRG